MQMKNGPQLPTSELDLLMIGIESPNLPARHVKFEQASKQQQTSPRRGTETKPAAEPIRRPTRSTPKKERLTRDGTQGADCAFDMPVFVFQSACECPDSLAIDEAL